MSTLKKIPLRVRVLLCVTLAALACLFLGAVRIQDSVRTQLSERADSGVRCRTILRDWNRAVPDRERTDWDRLSEENPLLCLRSLCTADPR